MLLFLNDIAASEVLVILIFILMFFGSKSIPGIARTMGRTIRQIKDASNELQQEIRKSGVDMKNDLNLRGMIDETAQDIRRPLDQYAPDIDEAIKFEPHAQSHIPAFPTSGKEDLGSAPPETPQNKPETIDPEQKLEQGKTKE